MTQPEYIRMRMALDEIELPAPRWPAGISRVTFEPERHGKAARALLNDAYAGGGGEVHHFAEWWSEISSDPEFDPALCFAAIDAKTSALAAFAQCWTSAFIKDIAVARPCRRRGVGRALLQEIFRAFHGRGAARVDLKVQADNPSGAVTFYRAVGMFVVRE